MKGIPYDSPMAVGSEDRFFWPYAASLTSVHVCSNMPEDDLIETMTEHHPLPEGVWRVNLVVSCPEGAGVHYQLRVEK